MKNHNTTPDQNKASDQSLENDTLSEEVAEIIAEETHQVSEEVVAHEEQRAGELAPEPLSEDLLAATAVESILRGSIDTPEVVVEEVLPPVSEFSEAALTSEVLAAVSAMGWTKPTVVQGMCLPYTLRGRDVAGFAQTGTGKTGVFLITIAQRLLAEAATHVEGEKKSTSPRAVVIVPTRELAIQIMEEATTLFGTLNLSTLAIYGGMEWEEQASKLQRGVDLLVATCGRLKDYYEKKFFDFSVTNIFVCDEVDRMFDMGFVTDVEIFLEQLPPTCQRLFFSATSNDKVKELSFEYLTKPVYISAQTDEMTPTNIEQHALLCETPDKLKVLLGLLAEHKPERSIIFTNTKLTAAWLQYKLRGNGIQVDLITGDLPQTKRIQLIKRIKQGEIKALIATDVASRGLHISDVSHVYNFDLPDDASNYVHRIGRTARAGAKGKAYSLVCEEYGANFLAIQELLGKDTPKPTWPDTAYLQMADKAGNPFEDNFGKGIVRKAPPSSMQQRGGRDGRDGRGDGRDGRDHMQRPQRGGFQDRDRRDSRDRNWDRNRRPHGQHDRYRGRDNRDIKRPGHKHVEKKAPSLGQMVKRIFSLVFFWWKKK